MKKRLYIVFAIMALVLASCRKDFDLYLYDGDKTIVYSVLEVDADTNFFRITKSSLSGEYHYGEDDIEVYFAGIFKNENTVDTVRLGAINETTYFTTKKLREGEEYELFIIRKEDNVKVRAKTRTICHIDFQKPMPNYPYIDFKNHSVKTVEWKGGTLATDHQINAGYFQVAGYFHYSELMPDATDTVNRSMEWYMGGNQADLLFNTSDKYYFVSYTPNLLFGLLERDDYLVNNSPFGVQRWMKDFEFRISVTGEELYYYNVSNSSGNHYPETSNYSNVENGIGILSSCATFSTYRIIEQVCRIRIANNYPYGFIYDPNR